MKALISICTSIGFFGLIAIAIASLPSCSDKLLPDDSEDDTSDSFAMTGSVRFNEPLPEGARLLVVWDLPFGDEGHLFAYGEGVIDQSDSTFRVEFAGPPIPGAINWEAYDTLGFGVGYIMITTDPEAISGRKLPESFGQSSHDTHGVISNTAIVYIAGNPEHFDHPKCREQWLRVFRSGFNVGTGFDFGCEGFTPAPWEEHILIVAPEPGDVVFPNWY